MIGADLTANERLLLAAALTRDPAVAEQSWQSWLAANRMEDAPYPELRLLPAVRTNLARLLTGAKLPQKLVGKARATFTGNWLLARAALPIVKALSRRTSVVLCKGVGYCIRFNAWAFRPLGDVDICVPFEAVEDVAAILESEGWKPKLGVTRASLLARILHRRASWNFTKGHGDLDLHWRFLAAENSGLERTMWSTIEPAELLGQPVHLESPEIAFLASLCHARLGTRGDAFQTIVDTPRWLSVCRFEALAPLLSAAEVWDDYVALLCMLREFGREDVADPAARVRPRVPPIRERAAQPDGGRRTRTHKKRADPAVLHRPRSYRFWLDAGHPAWAERMMIRWKGPLSKPLAAPKVPAEEYDLRDYDTLDRIGGPGFSWPEVNCVWSDGADARLLLPLSEIADHVLILDLAEFRTVSPNPNVAVFANGVRLTTLDLREFRALAGFGIVVPRTILFGAWVELAFRPLSYAGRCGPDAPYRLKRSLPFRRLRIYPAARVGALLGFGRVAEIQLAVCAGNEPQASRYARIRRKIEASPLREAAGIPAEFDPDLYVLLHPDLFEAEVDPFEHYLQFGKREGRTWR